MIAAHPLVSGSMPQFMPHRPPRPEKSEGGIAFKLVSEYEPKGDQPTAIEELVEGVDAARAQPGAARRHRLGQDLHRRAGDLRTQRPALVLAPNKTLAAQLYGEFKSFFPDNAVEYFVSYYDYYQPEAYVPRTDTYIEKELSVNEQIDRMRHAATRSLLERDDVIIVASVSCIYGIGSVETYTAMTFTVQTGESLPQRQLLADLVALHYRRSDANFIRGTFRVRGDTVELFPAHLEDRAWRISLFGDEVESITEFDPLTGAEDRRAETHQGLLQLALRHAQADPAAGHQVHQGRAQAAAGGALQLRPPAGGAAPRAAHRVRHGDDGGDRLLRRHRELLALSHRPPARRAAADPVRVPARQRAGVRRREPRHRAADRRHVPRRLPPQGDAGRIRLPPALLHGQPPAALRGVGRHAAADHVRLGHARRLGAEPDRRRLRRAGDPPHRPDRSAGRGPPRQDPGRRPDRRGAPGVRARATARSSPRSPSAWRRTSPSTCTSRASACATCTPTSRRWSASRSSATCGWAPSTC